MTFTVWGGGWADETIRVRCNSCGQEETANAEYEQALINGHRCPR